MSRISGSAAVITTPESAETVAELLAQSRAEAEAAAAALLAACSNPGSTPEDLARAADKVLATAGLLRGYATLSIQ